MPVPEQKPTRGLAVYEELVDIVSAIHRASRGAGLLSPRSQRTAAGGHSQCPLPALPPLLLHFSPFSLLFLVRERDCLSAARRRGSLPGAFCLSCSKAGERLFTLLI